MKKHKENGGGEIIYRENDNIDYEAIKKYQSMTREERDALLKKLEAEAREKINKKQSAL